MGGVPTALPQVLRPHSIVLRVSPTEARALRRRQRAGDLGVDVADDTFVRADPGVLRALLDLDDAASVLWPHLAVTLTRDRGAQGAKYTVTGPVTGDMEVWLEPWGDGVLVHHYLRGTVAPGGRLGGRAAVRAHTLAWKRVVDEVKDVLEGRRG